MPDEVKENFNPNTLSEKDQKDFEFVNKRILELQEARKKKMHGIEIETIWRDADEDYPPHLLTKTGGRNAIVTDEEKGLRGTSRMVKLGAQGWQSDVSQPNVFTKIQVALSILVDQNPKGVFTAGAKKYEATTELIKQLYQRSWDVDKSKQQLKLFAFNLAKYGWAAARTYPLRRAQTVNELVRWDDENPEKSEYEEREVVEFNDIHRENLDPWNVWIDDMARPNDRFSINDWSWRKVYTMADAEAEFGSWSNFKHVTPGGDISNKISENQENDESLMRDDLVEVKFYENKAKDLFYVLIHDVPVVISPIPVSDARGAKKLSLWQSYWNLRHAESPFGIGIYEAIRYDQAVLDRWRNMTIDQLTLSIYKMFFYSGTEALTEDGTIDIVPGLGRQTLDPKNINFLDVPGPGREAWEGIDRIRSDVDEASGITDPLLGNITGKTAFELAQSKESALKRLKSPLDNITDALDADAYITISLAQILYSIPEVHTIADPDLIEEYLREVEGDDELWERDENDNFNAKIFREFPFNLDEDQGGNLIETEEMRFLRVKPRYLNWDGIINVESQSVLSTSEQVEKALTMEMYNMLIPLFAQPPELYLKTAKDIVRLYDKDPDDVLPDSWLNPQPQQEPLLIPSEGGQGQVGGQAQDADRVVSSVSAPQRPQSLVGRIASRVTRPFRQ